MQARKTELNSDFCDSVKFHDQDCGMAFSVTQETLLRALEIPLPPLPIGKEHFCDDSKHPLNFLYVVFML